MKNKTTSLVAFAVMAMAAIASGAATVSYSTYIATSSTDTSWITAPAGSAEIAAFNVGGGETTYGGTTWLNTYNGGAVYNTATTISFYYDYPSVAWGNTASGFYSGGPALLNNGGWWPSNTNALVELRGFSIGQQYLVQFVFADTRYDGGTLSVQGVTGVTGNSTSTTYSYTDGRYLVVNAKFTADTVDTQWIPNVGGGAGEQINGIRIVAIPEPSATLLGGLGMLALLRRRR